MFLESEVKSDQQFENVHFCIPVATKWLYLKTKPQKMLVFLVKKNGSIQELYYSWNGGY